MVVIIFILIWSLERWNTDSGSGKFTKLATRTNSVDSIDSFVVDSDESEEYMS